MSIIKPTGTTKAAVLLKGRRRTPSDAAERICPGAVGNLRNVFPHVLRQDLVNERLVADSTTPRVLPELREHPGV